MSIIDFASRIDNAIRLKLKCKVDPSTGTYIELSSVQRQNIIDLYMEFVDRYETNILNYLFDISGDKEFIEWSSNNWSNMHISMAVHHNYANILEACIKSIVKNYMQSFHRKCTVIGAQDLYQKRLKETAKILEAHRNAHVFHTQTTKNICNIQ